VQVADVTDVEEIEGSVGESDGIAGATPVGYAVVELIAS
jgi:hypothetical protein